MRNYPVKCFVAIMLLTVIAGLIGPASAQAPFVAAARAAIGGSRATIAVGKLAPEVWTAAKAARSLAAEPRLGLATADSVWDRPAKLGEVQESDLKTACTESATRYDRDRASDRISAALMINAKKLGSSLNNRDDDVQDALVKLLAACERILNGRYDGRIQGFVLEVLKNSRIDKFRRETKWTINTVTLDDCDMLSTTPPQLQCDLRADLETRDLITRLAPTLTTRGKEVLMGLGSDLSVPEVAQQLGISAKRVSEIRIDQIQKKYLDLEFKSSLR
jgi:DNA-directed RNA polymerase specialized sigma24 family protein